MCMSFSAAACSMSVYITTRICTKKCNFDLNKSWQAKTAQFILLGMNIFVCTHTYIQTYIYKSKLTGTKYLT
jgi:hypothetical protein